MGTRSDFLSRAKKSRCNLLDIHAPELSRTSENANWCEEVRKEDYSRPGFRESTSYAAKEILLDIHEIDLKKTMSQSFI